MLLTAVGSWVGSRVGSWAGSWAGNSQDELIWAGGLGEVKSGVDH